MKLHRFQRLNADEKMRRRMADRDKEATDLAIIKGAVRKQALAEGIEKGEKLGIEKGEDRACRAVALRLIEKGLSLEMISEVTGLKPDEINSLLVS